MGEAPRVTVVVPTRGRQEALGRCVAALEGQTLEVEIVVVEDVEGRGPAWARNEGVRRAQGEVVCFTDDDCEPVAGWAEVLAAPIFSGEAGAATGPVSIGAGASAADRAWEAIVRYLQASSAAPGTASPGFAVTANLGAKRSLLERLPFDESFPAAAGEDRDWGERAARAGLAL
ncbi:MAG TPA: glycosyltransferase, partial [Solirubrobacterales bacterium]|nr:glycosyltransferase [Solirubrobacterales bacterium]